MSRIRSDRLVHVLGGLFAGLALAGGAAAQEPTAEAAGAVRLLSSEVSMSRGEAVLNLELSDGRELSYVLRDNRAFIGGDVIGTAPAPLQASWRQLLGRAMEARADELPALLIGWDAPSGSDVGQALDQSLEEALRGVELNAAAVAQDAPLAPAAPASPSLSNDSVRRLVDRISELQAQVEVMESQAARGYMRDDNVFSRFFGHIGRGIAGIISLLVTYAVLFGIGFATIVLGGRRFIEGVGDTARHATIRSGLVGLAATFLIVPAFVLGIIALVVSIIGIPALLVFVPLFPLAVVVALLLGYLGVAHAAGEAFAERRYSGQEWYRRGNSYYFLLVGLGLLFALFLGAQVLELTGPFLGFVRGILTFLGVVLTWAVLTIGFGAVLISRGGTRPAVASSFTASESYTETTSV